MFKKKTNIDIIKSRRAKKEKIRHKILGYVSYQKQII